MTATAIEPVELSTVREASQGYQLVAIDQPQLQQAHGRMIEWAREQAEKCEAEKSEESENLRIAMERKWATAPFRKRIAMLERRITFYRKIRTALELGFVIVPNFEMTVFAIRTNRDTPRTQRATRNWGTTTFTEAAGLLPAGEGEYQAPDIPTYSVKDTETNAKGEAKEVTRYWTAEEYGDIDFPIALAKPVLMTKTAEAMAVKVFDEVGVAVDTRWRGRGRGDPIILGRIRNPRKAPDMTFFIGWYFDPSRI